jgi:hypothetical protein
MDGERVLTYCSTKYWIWVCTDKRVIKYKQGSGGAEALHDLSFREISGISLVNTGRNDWIGGFGILGALFGLLVLLESPELGVLSLVVGGGLIYYWLNSESSYFEFRGTGLIRKEPEKWRIDEAAAEDPGEVREFVRTVRSQLG